MSSVAEKERYDPIDINLLSTSIKNFVNSFRDFDTRNILTQYYLKWDDSILYHQHFDNPLLAKEITTKYIDHTIQGTYRARNVDGFFLIRSLLEIVDIYANNVIINGPLDLYGNPSDSIKDYRRSDYEVYVHFELKIAVNKLLNGLSVWKSSVSPAKEKMLTETFGDKSYAELTQAWWDTWLHLYHEDDSFFRLPVEWQKEIVRNTVEAEYGIH